MALNHFVDTTCLPYVRPGQYESRSSVFVKPSMCTISLLPYLLQNRLLEQISKTTVVCSKHFTKEDYTGWTPLKDYTGWAPLKDYTGWTPLKIKFKKIAVPTVFQWTDDKAPRRILKRHY